MIISSYVFRKYYHIIHILKKIKFTVKIDLDLDLMDFAATSVEETENKMASALCFFPPFFRCCRFSGGAACCRGLMQPADRADMFATVTASKS